jgi:hypothetical protein
MNSPTGTSARPSTGGVGLQSEVADLAARVSTERMAATVAALAGARFEGRRVGTAGGAGARAWLLEHLAGLGAEARVDGFEVAGYGAAANVHGLLRESGPGGVDLLLTAHYDGVGDLGGVHRPGASDNASGVAVAVEAARLLRDGLPVGAGLAVALLDAEEVGALGSARHAAQLLTQGRAPLVLNVDGAGRLDAAVAVEAGGPAQPLLAALDAAGRALGVPLRGGKVASDNRRYAGAGLGAVGLGAGMPGYHTEHDTPANVDPATLSAMVRLVVASVKALAGEADLERLRREEGLEHE